MMKKMMFAAAVCAVVLGLFTACGKQEKTTLTLVTEATFPPYEYRAGKEFCGIDIDICTAAAKKLGKTLKVEDTKFDSVIAFVATGKADIAASGITVTEDRKKKILFTDPYVEAYQTIMVPKGSAIKTKEDLKKPGLRVGCQSATTGYDYVRNNIITEKNSPYLQQYDNGALAVEAMKAGKVDVVVLDEGPSKSLVAQNAGVIVLLDEPLTKEEYAIALNKKDVELCKVFNEVIKEMKANGELEKSKAKHKAATSKAQ